jgi:hypothetical protein
VTVEQGQETAASAEASFTAGFNKGTGAEPAKPAVEKQEPAAPAAQPATPAKTPAKDPWEGVQPAIRTTLEAISANLGKIDHRLKTTEGRVGALQAAQQTAKSVKTAGGAAPSQEQIQAASGSGEKWAALLENFPDFKEGLEERFAAIDAALQKQKPFDNEGFRREIDGVRATFAQSARELREVSKLDRKHEDWEDTINTPEFKEWSFSNGPSATEQAQWYALKAQSPDGKNPKADEFFAAFELRYPLWWQEKGAHMASPSAKDAIALLDNYKAHNQAVSVKTQQQAKSAQRLQAAITPTGAPAAPGQPPLDEEAAFAKGFKRAQGR